jgi:hypothetical protein
MLLLVAVAGLSGLLIVALGQRGLSAWQSYSSTKEIEAADAGANQFIAGVFEILMERLYTNNALQAADPVDAATLREIQTHRKAVKDNYEAGLAVLKEHAFPERDALLSALQSALAKANDYRSQADRAITMPRDQRDENLRKTFIPVITDSVNASLKVWFAALHDTAGGDPRLASLAVVKEIGWRMRDVAGTERSNIAAAISAGTPVPADRIAANAAIRAQVDLLWQQLGNLTGGKNAQPAIIQAMNVARDQYFNGFRKLSDDMRKAGEEGGKYPMTGNQWVDTTTPQLGTLLGVMYGAGKASETYTAKLGAGALTDLAIALGLLGLGIAVATGAAFIVIRRVTRPLTALAAAMHRLASGNT